MTPSDRCCPAPAKLNPSDEIDRKASQPQRGREIIDTFGEEIALARFIAGLLTFSILGLSAPGCLM